MLRLQNLLDDAKRYGEVRRRRWPEGIRCPHGESAGATGQGRGTARRRYFDDLTGTVFAGHHRPLRVWILCLYLTGLNLSNRQIAQEPGLNKDDAQRMAAQLREGIVAAQPGPALSGEVACDEVYATAGRKGRPEAVEKKAARDGGGA